MAFRESQLTVTLLTSVVAAVLGSLQVGYQSGNINAPARIIEEFINVTWTSRYNESISKQSLTLLWSLSVSVKDFGAMLGSLGVKGLSETYGRRNSILIANVFSVVGVCLMFTSNVAHAFELLIVGRFIFGLFCGLAMSLNPLYIQGISPINLRGAFSTLNQVFFTCGIFFGMVMSLETVLGTEKYWNYMMMLSLIPAFIQYITLLYCPESPRYLFISCEKEKEAHAALRKLRANHDELSQEMEAMKEEASQCKSKVTVWEFFSKRCYRQSIILVLIINLGSQLSGFNAYISYSTKIFTRAGLEEANYLTLGVGVVNMASTVIAVSLMERAGRRTLLLTGFLSLALCNLLMTITDSLLDVVPDIKGFQVFVIFCLISSYELGPGPISWFIAAELFDQPAKPIAMAFTSMMNWGGKFLLTLLYPPLLKLLGGFVYLLFLAISFAAFIYTMFRLPETKGRTFDCIAAELSGADSIALHNKKSFNTFN